VSGSADSTVRVWTVPIQQYTNGSLSPPPGRLNAFLGLPRTEPVVLQGHVGGVLALEVLRKRRGKEGAVLVLSGGEDKQVCVQYVTLLCTITALTLHRGVQLSGRCMQEHSRSAADYAIIVAKRAWS
jgi:WD40 repeat protein